MNLIATLSKHKPNAKPVTIRTYAANLNKLARDISDQPVLENMDFLQNYDAVMAYLEKYQDTSKRNYLNAIVVLLGCDDKQSALCSKYGKVRDELNNRYFKQQSKKSDKQAANWVSKDQIAALVKQYDTLVRQQQLKRKTALSRLEYHLLMQWLVLHIYTHGILHNDDEFPPLRNDIAGMRLITKRQYNNLSNDDKRHSNYLVIGKSMKMILNEYKTAKNYREIVIVVPKSLEKHLRAYLKQSQKISSEYLLASYDGQPLSRNALSKLLLRLFQDHFAKNISTTMLRHIYLSNKYSKVKEDMEADAKSMGHSVSTQQNVYVKE